MPDIRAEEDLLRLSRCVTVIGNIAILSLPPGIDASLRDVANALVAQRTHLRTVLNKVTRLEGDHRVARYQILAGDGTVAVHREFGFSYALDVREVFFNPRLASERRRVAVQVCPGEEVLVPFAGSGPSWYPLRPEGRGWWPWKRSPRHAGGFLRTAGTTAWRSVLRCMKPMQPIG